MPDATPPVDPGYLTSILIDAAKTYIAANAGPWTAEAEAYVNGSVAAQIEALTAHNMKVISAA